MPETEALLCASLPRALTHSRVFRQSTARRLFKARHLELEQFEIATQIVSITSEENVAPITVYSMRMQHRHHPNRRSTQAPWVLERRYSEFYGFRKRLLALIKKWEDNAAMHERETKEFIAISSVLWRPFTHDFPRRHMRVDTTTIITERRVGLEAFVRKLLTAYVEVSVYVLECSSLMSTGSYGHLTSLCQEIELFIDVPASEKEIERYWTAAIRSLTDVEEAPNQPTQGSKATAGDGYECCICMNNMDQSEIVVRMPGDDKLVRLPCAHNFHEDCVIDWFSTSMTCPLCRQVVVDINCPSSLSSQSEALTPE